MKMTIRMFLCLTVLSLACCLTPTVRAERIPMTPEQLVSNSTNIVVGGVTGIFSKTNTEGNYERTHFVAEVRVVKSERGDFQKDTLIYVRYWQQRWAGRGAVPPGTNGFRDVPKEGETLRMHLVRNGYNGFGTSSDGGLDVLGPNGFSREGVAATK